MCYNITEYDRDILIHGGGVIIVNNKNPEWKILATFSILFIVWGHHFGHPINRYIFSFHVPLLYFLVGLLHKREEKISFGKYFLYQTKRILAPYLVYALILYAIWFIIIYMTGNATEKGLSPLNNFLGIFYVQGMNDYMDWGLQMWCFPSIFLTTLIAYPIIKLEEKNYLFWGITAIAFIVGLSITRVIPFSLPWSMDASMIGVIFYITGYKASKLKFTEKKTLNLIMVLILLGLGILIQYFNSSRIDMKLHWYGNPVLFLTGALCSIFAYYILSRLLSNIRLLQYPGMFIVPIYVFHMRIWTFLNVALQKIVPTMNRSGLLETLLFSFIQIGMIIILTLLYRKAKVALQARKLQ